MWAFMKTPLVLNDRSHTVIPETVSPLGRLFPVQQGTKYKKTRTKRKVRLSDHHHQIPAKYKNHSKYK